MSKNTKQAADRPRVDPLGDLKIAEARGIIHIFILILFCLQVSWNKLRRKHLRRLLRSGPIPMPPRIRGGCSKIRLRKIGKSGRQMVTLS